MSALPILVLASRVSYLAFSFWNSRNVRVKPNARARIPATGYASHSPFRPMM